jgi:hypothetical protein
VCTCHPSYVEKINRKIVVQVSLGIKGDLISKITKAKRAGDVTQVVSKAPALQA